MSGPGGSPLEALPQQPEAVREGRLDPAVVAWAVLVFALLFLGLTPLYVLHQDLAKLNANSSSAPPIVIIGIL